VTEDYYIVADEIPHTLLVSNQSLKEGSAYKIIILRFLADNNICSLDEAKILGRIHDKFL
jgi:hypothetical protein